MTFGLIVGNRGFFPDHLAKSGREQMIAVLQQAGHEVVCLTPEQSKHGAVETRAEARKCADLFKANRDRMDGIIVTLPNFGEERGVAEALRMADLRIPVLIQATPDSAGRMTIADRRDSFCGKMSVCNNLQQYRIPYSLTANHTVAPDSPAFAADVAWFAAICRVANGLRKLRIGAIGARPAAFNTVRYSRKDSGIERHHHRAARPFGSVRPHRPAEMRGPRRTGEGSLHPRVCLDAKEFRTTPSSKCPCWAWSSTAG